MRRHAKASSAGSTLGRGNSLGSIRRAFATRGAPPEANGSGAPSRRRPRRLALSILLGLLFAMALTATPASAEKIHLLKETFGSAVHPSFAKPWGLAVDQASGDVLAIDKGANEEQEVKIEAGGTLGGTYKLSFGGQSTGATGSGDLFATATGSGDLSGAEATGTLTVLGTGTGTRTVLGTVTGTRASVGTGNGNLVAGSTVVTGLTTSTGAFAAGESISGTGIPVGTTIASCSPNCTSPTGLTLSAAVEAGKSASAVALFSGSKTITGLTTPKSGTLTVGESISAVAGIPVGATIASCAPNPDCTTPTSLTLSLGATAAGTSLLTSGSKIITGLTTSTGAFTAGESISGSGIPLGATIASCSSGCTTGSLTLSFGVTTGALSPGTSTTLTSGSKTITLNTTNAGTYAVGQTVTGPPFGPVPLSAQETIVSCVPDCTTPTSLSAGNTLTLSLGVTGAGTGIALKAGSFEVKNVTGGPFNVGQSINVTSPGTGIPTGTVVKAVKTVAGNTTITLSNFATNGGRVALSAGASTTVLNVVTSTGAFSLGESITGTGIPAGATIVSITGNTLTLSAAATANGTSVALAANLPFGVTSTNLKEALEKLPSIGAGNVFVGGSGATSPVKRTIEFQSGLGGKDVEAIGCDPSGLTGTGPTCAVTTTAAGATFGIKRFNPDGTPANFSALGTNLIDGRKGALGKACGEEPSSCDETPQANGLSSFTENTNGSQEVQVAVDNSGGANNGNIYVTQVAAPARLIDIFAPDGHYLGQLTKAGATNFGQPCGVTVDEGGNVYVGNWPDKVSKFAPNHNPLLNTDNTLNFSAESPCYVAAGAGLTAGFIFVNQIGTDGTVKKFDSATGEFKYTVVSGHHNTLAVNPADGHLLASDLNVVKEYDASGDSAPTEAFSKLTAPSTVEGVAVDGTTGDVYVSRAGSANLEVYLPPVDALIPIAKAASAITGAKATLNGTVTVSPESGAIEECKFEYLTAAAYAAAGNSFSGSGANAPATALCVGSIPTDSSPHAVSAAVGGLTPNGTTYYFRLTGKNIVGTVSSAPRTFATIKTAITEAATAIGASAATLNGTLRNEEDNPFTACVFEYLTEADYLANGGSYSGPNVPLTKTCTPAVDSIEADFEPHPVSAALTGLAKSTTYHFRLVATNSASGAVRGEDRQLSTLGPPQVLEEFAGPVGKTTAALNASLNPSGFATTYHFEWGPCVTSSTCSTSPYGNQAPDFDPFAGSGTSPVRVTASLTGLQESAAYHFRLIATNHCNTALPSELCTTTGAGGEFTTLNAAGLPDNRRFELVSPPDKRPAGAVTIVLGSGLLNWQAAADGQSVAYTINNGLADATTGGEVIYVAHREEGGWSSTQASPPSLVPSPLVGAPSYVNYFNPDVTCGFVETPSPLTEDVPAIDKEEEVTNLYRRNGDGSFTLISNLAPSNAGLVSPNIRLYHVGGASPSCDRVYFSTRYQLLPGASGLYEWHDGTLHDAGIRPDGSVAPPVVATETQPRMGGEFSNPRASSFNAVSADAGRFVFTSKSNETPDSGQQTVFMRKNGASTVDVSKPATVTPSLGARYEVASSDGSHVFFAANLGLAGPAGVGPQENCAGAEIGATTACDLYDYDVDANGGAGALTDLTTDTNPADTKGAVVQGVVGVSEEGDYVYFAAKGQLLPVRGKTFAQNSVAGAGANIYLAHGGQLHYVANVSALDLNGNAPEVNTDSGAGVLVRNAGSWSAQVTPSGHHLLFESRSNIAGYENGFASEAYLYSVASEGLTCVSCRTDGQPSVNSPLRTQDVVLPLKHARPISDDGRRVFFTSYDALAPGGVDGERNIYEWENGQVSFLTTTEGILIGSSKTGDDVFLTSTEQLDAHDFDHEFDLYDARVGGGFPPPAEPPVPCDVATSQCQGPEAPQPAGSNPASQSPSGEGNPPLQPPPCPKGKVRRHGKCVPRKHRRHCPKGKVRRHGKCVPKKHHKRHNRAANTNRGGVK